MTILVAHDEAGIMLRTALWSAYTCSYKQIISPEPLINANRGKRVGLCKKSRPKINGGRRHGDPLRRVFAGRPDQLIGAGWDAILNRRPKGRSHRAGLE